MKTHSNIQSLALVGLIASSATPAHAVENILHSYQNPRTSGMGGMKLTTGLYEDNFTGNPARVTANPKWKVQLVDIATETQPEKISTLATAASDGIDGIMDTTGEQNHVRVSPTLLGIYLPFENMSYAFGVQGSVQADVGVSNAFRIDSQILGDIGPTFTVGRKFLEDKELSVGVSAHYNYRFSAPQIQFTDFLTGNMANLFDNAGEGSKFDFDVGATYILPWKPDSVDFITALSINNIMDQQYSGGLNLLGGSGSVPASGRTVGLGFTAHKSTTGAFRETSLGLEVQDLGANTDGSIFRMLHIGGETHWKLFAIRLGVNQGYLCAGLGFDFKVLQLDLATSGEEMSLNAGGRENRSVALRLGIQI